MVANHEATFLDNVQYYWDEPKVAAINLLEPI